MISLTSPVKTRAHGWPAGLKLGALCLITTGLMLTQDLRIHLAVLAVTGLLYALPGRAFLMAGLRALRLLLSVILLLLIWHLISGQTWQGLAIILRIVTLVGLSNLVTMTTPLEDMVDLLHRLGAPLRRLGLPMHLLEIAMPLVIRFTPVLVTRAETLAEAWRARSRRRPGWQLILPLMLQALDDADHVGEALRARGGALPRPKKE